MLSFLQQVSAGCCQQARLCEVCTHLTEPSYAADRHNNVAEWNMDKWFLHEHTLRDLASTWHSLAVMGSEGLCPKSRLVKASIRSTSLSGGAGPL